MIEYLKEKGGYTSSGLTIEEKKELENLWKEVKEYREREEENKSEKSETSEKSNSSESNSEDEKEVSIPHDTFM